MLIDSISLLTVGVGPATGSSCIISTSVVEGRAVGLPPLPPANNSLGPRLTRWEETVRVAGTGLTGPPSVLEGVRVGPSRSSTWGLDLAVVVEVVVDPVRATRGRARRSSETIRPPPVP